MKKFSLKPNLSRPTPSLRLAFWGLIVTSGLYWTLALIIGSALLSSCSGSIFTDNSKPPMSTEFAPAPSEGNRVLVEEKIIIRPDNEEIVSDAEIETYAATPALKLYTFLFPGTIAAHLRGLDKSKIDDALARLKLSITVHPKVKTKGTIGVTRKVDILLLDASKAIGARSITVTPTQELSAGNVFFGDGVLLDESDRKIRTLITFNFSNGNLVSGKIMKYLNEHEGEERDTFVLDMKSVTVKILD